MDNEKDAFGSDEVRGVAALALDKAVLAAAGASFKKIAMVVSRVYLSEPLGRKLTEDAIHGRVVSLVDRGLLESQGDVSKMRESEVRWMGGKDQSSGGESK